MFLWLIGFITDKYLVKAIAVRLAAAAWQLIPEIAAVSKHRFVLNKLKSEKSLAINKGTAIVVTSKDGLFMLDTFERWITV